MTDLPHFTNKAAEGQLRELPGLAQGHTAGSAGLDLPSPLSSSSAYACEREINHRHRGRGLGHPVCCVFFQFIQNFSPE